MAFVATFRPPTFRVDWRIMEVYGAIGGAILLGLTVLEAGLRVFGKKSLLDLFRGSGSAETSSTPLQITVVTPPVPTTTPASRTQAPWLGRPASIGATFVGRDKDLLALQRLLGANQASVLCGGPGTGKSRLAAELTYVGGGHGFWANGAATAERTLGGLAVAFRTAVEGKDDGEAAAEVRR